MNNYAGRKDFEALDADCAKELEEAEIKVYKMSKCLRGRNTEVATIVLGSLHGWSFERAWYYWTAKGPGIPLAQAMELHAKHGKVVRVNGDCTGPSPLDQFRGLACGSYHVDTQEGLNALASTIRQVVDDAKSVANPYPFLD